MFHVVLFITSGGWVEVFIVLNFVALAPGNLVVVSRLRCVRSALPPSPSFGSHLREPAIIALGTFPPLTVLAAGGTLLHLPPLLQANCTSSGELLVSLACPNQRIPIAMSPECVSDLVQGETTT